MNLMVHVIIHIVTWKHFYNMWVVGPFSAVRPVLNPHIQRVPKLEFWIPFLWPLEMWNCEDVSNELKDSFE